MNQDEQPEHSPENDDEPEGEGAAGDADNHQQVVFDWFRHLGTISIIDISHFMMTYQWIIDLLWANADDGPDDNHVGGEDVPGDDWG